MYCSQNTISDHVEIYGNSFVIRNDPNDDFSLNL
ncbi:hypothetical protein SLEP1_g58128 [Rubroshorea leprosula]|uniref:Uncharacterized protein n=1 Tax=Rubroshorea leprosula TaxID=152421 RepID=A0AAV5MNK1_9ROSI|nr:hypothetical protein SLEP1_g58128 [Rubroshorea leprosula]